MFVLGARSGIFYKPDGKKLAGYLESLGPIFIKFGQLLSTRTDILDVGTAKDLQGDDIKRLMAGGAEIGDLAKELAAT